MTNREKLIELLTEENDGVVNSAEIARLLEESPLLGESSHVGFCPNDFKCEDSGCSCAVCAAKWLNEKAKE
jgi:hypothetical protein